MGIEYLDGIRLYRVITAGLQRILTREEYLNKINVFPVPDGDTGTNMVYTLTTIKDGIHQKVHSDIYQMSVAIADSALDGARGNAGSILAQFLVGLSEGINKNTKLNTEQFAAAVEVGKQYAYQALLNPVEGTILSVINDWSDALKKLSERITDFRSLLKEALKKANKSLADTPKKLKVLAEAGVVDAGGQGFVDLLEGIQDYITSGKITAAKPVKISSEKIEKISFKSKYRYCAECIIKGHNINRIKLRDNLMSFGDSLIIAGSKHKAKVHIHTNDPKQVFEICGVVGELVGVKADDMVEQQKDARAEHKSIALLVDSTADLPDNIIDDNNIHVIPVRLSFGEKHYIDKTTLTIEEFWAELKTNPNHPKTSQPTPGDFRRQYQFLSTHYESAISIHLPPAVSGTYQSAVTASKTLNNFPINIVDANNVSIATGLIAVRAAEAINANKSFDEVKSITNQAIANTKIYILLETLEFLVRGGRLTKSKRRIADLIQARPILSLSGEGKIDSVGKIIGRKNRYDKFLRFIMKKIPTDAQYRIGIVHGDNPAQAKQLAKYFSNIIGDNNVFLSQLGPALGTHAGPGAIAVAIQSLKDALNE